MLSNPEILLKLCAWHLSVWTVTSFKCKNASFVFYCGLGLLENLKKGQNLHKDTSRNTNIKISSEQNLLYATTHSIATHWVTVWFIGVEITGNFTGLEPIRASVYSHLWVGPLGCIRLIIKSYIMSDPFSNQTIYLLAIRSWVAVSACYVRTGESFTVCRCFTVGLHHSLRVQLLNCEKELKPTGVFSVSELNHHRTPLRPNFPLWTSRVPPKVPDVERKPFIFKKILQFAKQNYFYSQPIRSLSHSR